MRNDGIVRIYTDGGCAGNQNSENLGGWGAILEFAKAGESGDGGQTVSKELHGSEANTTNNRMEMTALLEAFRALKKDGQQIQVFSDSGYLMDCFRKKWYVNWQANGWKNAQKKPVENQDLWKELLPFLDRHDIEFFRVKGHVNLNSESVNVMNLYGKFCEWNGGGFSLDEFRYITEKNNRADELANEGIDELR
ncbi:MAG: ribonuclease HI [Firmicutes bacterium]|nr:ribonuclease HI [Bacillota bacterium]